MIKQAEIRSFCEKVARDFNPEKIILFGSYANGSAGEESDVDILVVMPFTGKPARKALQIMERSGSKLPLDLLVRTPSQINRRLKMGDFFISEIIDTGKTLYEADS